MHQQNFLCCLVGHAEAFTDSSSASPAHIFSAQRLRIVTEGELKLPLTTLPRYQTAAISLS